MSLAMKSIRFTAVICVFLWASSDFAQAQLFRRPVAQTVTKTVLMPEISLFNGTDLAGWTTVIGTTDITAWEVEDGMIHREFDGGDIITETEYRNFVLDFDWKIAPGGNSGVKYKWGNYDGSWIGCEYQLLDDIGNSEGTRKKHQTGDLYDMFAADPNKHLNPAGEFNHSRIVVNGNRIQHWLNDMLILDVRTNSCQWQRALAESKFNEHPCFGRIATGKILLQNHGSEVWFKDIKLQEIQTVRMCQVRQPSRRLFHR